MLLLTAHTIQFNQNQFEEEYHFVLVLQKNNNSISLHLLILFLIQKNKRLTSKVNSIEFVKNIKLTELV